MAFDSIYQIAGSAMNAQTVRLNTVASNLANVDSAAGSAKDVYQARKPVFAAVYENNQLSRGAGNVFYPDISEIEEMTDMMSATRSFETGVEVLNRIKSMQQGLLKLGEA